MGKMCLGVKRTDGNLSQKAERTSKGISFQLLAISKLVVLHVVQIFEM